MTCEIYDLRGARILTMEEVCAMVRYAPRHVCRLVVAGLFPKPLQLGSNLVAWRLADIEDWLVHGAVPVGPVTYDDPVCF
jgi:predicted DNA-binding transcriptional regulator AlpA